MGGIHRNTIINFSNKSTITMGDVHVEMVAAGSDVHELDKAEIAEIERVAIAREEDEALSMTPSEHRKLIRRIDIGKPVRLRKGT